MKKYILSFLIIGTFGLYILYSRSINPSNSLADASSVSIPITSAQSLNINQNSVSNNPPPQATKTTPITTTTITPVAAITPKQTGQYIDGSYTGISANAYYGYIQVLATISGGKLTDVKFLDYPKDRGTSRSINSQAMPLLKAEAIKAQSAKVNTISGASDSSGAFRQSLASALSQANNS